jgi:hypothetical protein
LPVILRASTRLLKRHRQKRKDRYNAKQTQHPWFRERYAIDQVPHFFLQSIYGYKKPDSTTKLQSQLTTRDPLKTDLRH